MRRLLLAVVSFALVAVPSVFGQNIGPLPPLTAHVDVNVVNVDVTVNDRDGRPVMNLTKDDFEILEDGKPQKVTNFSIVQNQLPRGAAGTAAATPAAAPSTMFGRKILLLVDNNFLEKAERNIALRKVERYLDQNFNGEWAVAVIGHAAEMVQPFTSDKTKVHAAFEQVRAMPSSFSQQEMDRTILSDRTRKQLEFATDYDYGESIRFTSRGQTYRTLLTMQNTARAVVETARAYGAEEGKKFIILLSGGMETNTTFTQYTGTRPDRELEQLKLDMAKVIDEMVHEANGANFTVHVVNARSRGMAAPQHNVENRSSGVRAPGGNLYLGNWGNDPIDTTDVDSAPLSIALGTGGLYLPSADVPASIAVIDEQTSNFYSLGYSPDHVGDRRYHTIKVRVKRGGVRVANRVGYYDLSSDDRLEDMLRARITFERSLGSLPVKISLGQVRTNERVMVLPVKGEIPLERITMLPRDEGYVGRVHVYLSVFDSRGRNVGFHHQTQEVSLTSPQLGAASGSFFHYTMNVRLQKGDDYTVVMTLRDELSNEIGSAVEPIRL
jgi:VWFA-related protein